MTERCTGLRNVPIIGSHTDDHKWAHPIRLRNSRHAPALNSRTGPRPFAFVSRTPTTGPAPWRAEASSTQLLPSPLWLDLRQPANLLLSVMVVPSDFCSVTDAEMTVFFVQ